MENYGYLQFNPVGTSIFSYPENGQLKAYDFNAQEPDEYIRTIATLIQKYNLEKVICNKIGFGLAGSISSYLKTTYNNFECKFELNN